MQVGKCDLTNLVFLLPETTLLNSILKFALIQVTYMLIHFSIRPIKETKDQLLEIVNELIYFSLIILLLSWKEEEIWSAVKTNVFIWVMVANTIIF